MSDSEIPVFAPIIKCDEVRPGESGPCHQNAILTTEDVSDEYEEGPVLRVWYAEGTEQIKTQ